MSWGSILFTTYPARDGSPGRFDERVGGPRREAYELFAYAWRNADRELQPMVDEARRAVARLATAARRPGS